MTDTHKIVVEDTFPHTPETLWKVLTDDALIDRWMPMKPDGFKPVPGTKFTFRTTPAGAWDGTIHCEVIEVIANEVIAYSWRRGDAGNAAYGAPLDTVVTMTLEKVAGGTRLRLVHSGFVFPRNETAFTGMKPGWEEVVARIGETAENAA